MASGPRFTDEEKAILRGPGRFATLREIAQLLPNRSAQVAVNVRHKLGIAEGWESWGTRKKPKAPEPPPLPSDVQMLKDENEQLRRSAVALQRQLAEAKAKRADLIAAVHQAAKEAALIAGPPKVIQPTADKRKAKEEVALLHVCDWQVGQVSESFNTEIARKRVELLAETVLRLIEIERAAHPVRKCVLLLGGDMVEGVQIFPGQAFAVDSSLYAQLFASAAMVETLVRTLAADVESLEVWCEWGNHGRLGRRGDYPGPDNVDLILYRIVQERTADIKHVEWHISSAWYQIVPIGNYRVLLVHGDEFKSFGGTTPAFGIARKVNAWASGVLPPFTDCMMGHFHQSMQVPLARGNGRVFLTPTIASGSDYAAEFVGATGTPAQRLHFVSPSRGHVTSERLVYLDAV